MSKLDELLQGVDVEWLPLEDYAIYEQPTKYLVKSKDYSNEYDIPVLTAGKTFILGYTNEKEGIYKASLTPVIIFDDFTTANKWVDFDFKAKSSAMKIIKSKDESKALLRYIYYWINSLPSDLVDGDHKRQWISNFSKKLIPIPPIEIQQEIVRVLDELTTLTNQLTTELETERQNRKKQFEFFREQLFRFEGKELEWNKLGSVADVTKLAGYEFTKHIKYSDEGNIIALRGLNVKGTLDLTNVKYIDGSEFTKLSRSKLYINDMLFTYVGTIGEIALINENDKYYLAPNVSRIRFENSKLLPSFMFYYFKTDFFVRNQINKYLSNSSMKNLTMENIRKFMVPIPPLEEQERIVKLLNQFDATHTAIEEEITKEIKLRTQQYEYYREKLLSFPQN